MVKNKVARFFMDHGVHISLTLSQAKFNFFHSWVLGKTLTRAKNGYKQQPLTVNH